MTAHAPNPAPNRLARVTGGLYLLIMVAALFAEGFVRSRLIAPGDGAATVRNILASESLWRWGVVADFATTVCDVAVAALLFILLRPVDRTLSLIATAFRLAYSAAMAANASLLAAPLFLLPHAAGPPVMEAAQLQGLVVYSLRLHAIGFELALIPFGVHLVLVGILIFRSGYLPAILGVGLAIAGVCYIAKSVLDLLAPAMESLLFPWILLPGFVAEGALALRLLIVGIRSEPWLRKCGAATG